MPVTHSEYGETTEASVVADAFSSQIKDRIILITGVNLKGIGGSTMEAFAAHSPRMLILAGRSLDKVGEAIKAVQPKYPDVSYRPLQLDLSSQASCRTAAKEILDAADMPHINILINNAGIMNLPERRLSPDGIELTFATNHIGHFLFTNLILPKLIKAAATTEKNSTRIINVSSRGILFSPVRFSDLNLEKPATALPPTEQPSIPALLASGITDPTPAYIPLVSYGQSKTANALFSLALTRRLASSSQHSGILSLALHPGAIETELGRYMDPVFLAGFRATLAKRGFFYKSLAQGASTTLVAALDPGLEVPRPGGDGGHKVGGFLSDCQIAEVPEWAGDWGMAERLWEVSEKLVGERFAV